MTAFVDPDGHPFGYPHASSWDAALELTGLDDGDARAKVSAYCDVDGDYLVPLAGPSGGCWLLRSRAA